MKHRELRAIVHNVADSLASGIGLLVGVYEMDVFGEASRCENGSLTVDLLSGRVADGAASESLSRAVSLYREALAKLCAGGSVGELREATVRFWSDALSPHFAVTIEDARGRRSTTNYASVPGRRPKVADTLGRLRPQPSIG
jgi:hypothetical protein